jgi:ketosteroid isomerase-like protein
MAIAVDWLDAYRARDIQGLLEFFADNAVVECACGDMKTITGKEGLRAYWVQRLTDYPASDLDDLQPAGDGASISYVTDGGVVNALLEFDAAGKITFLHCGQIALSC